MQNSKKKILEIIKSMGSVGSFLDLLWKIAPAAGGVIMTIFGWMNEYPALWMIGEAIVLISVYRWWTGRQQKSSDPQEDEAEKPGIQEQPPKPDEPPEEPKRRPRSWEIKAERAQQFTVYEVACLLAGTAPVWPLPTPESKEEYELLRLALLDDELGGELAYEAGFAEGDGGDESRLHLVELERRNLRAYLQAKGREIPEFLDERFDKRPRQYMPFKHQ